MPEILLERFLGLNWEPKVSDFLKYSADRTYIDLKMISEDDTLLIYEVPDHNAKMRSMQDKANVSA